MLEGDSWRGAMVPVYMCDTVCVRETERGMPNQRGEPLLLPAMRLSAWSGGENERRGGRERGGFVVWRIGG